MEIGMSLPTMARGYTRDTTLVWSRGIDAGPFSSISCGERITFHNPEMMVTLGAAAVLTERVRVFANLVVTPMHPTALVAKQLATLHALSGGRLTVGVGVGGREHDYRALGVPFERRHARLDEQVAALGGLLGGEAPFPGADPVGPAVQTRAAEQAGGGGALAGIELLAGAMGPKGLARAARWADGVSGFSLTADPNEMAKAAAAARAAWEDAGRDRPPRLVSGCFFALGVDDPAATLARFTHDYLAVFGEDVAASFAELAPVWHEDRLREVLEGAAAAGLDEFILVPATVDERCLEAAAGALR